MRIMPITARMLDDDGDDEPNKWDILHFGRYTHCHGAVWYTQSHAIDMLNVGRHEEKTSRPISSPSTH